MRLPTCVGSVAQAEKMQIPGHGLAAGGKSPGGGRGDPLGSTRGGARAWGLLEARHSARGAPGGGPLKAPWRPCLGKTRRRRGVTSLGINGVRSV